MNMPPEVLRSRSFTRFTMRVGLPHLGQSVLFEVSIIFSRPAVLATLAMVEYSPVRVSRGLGRRRAVRLWQTRGEKANALRPEPQHNDFTLAGRFPSASLIRRAFDRQPLRQL